VVIVAFAFPYSLICPCDFFLVVFKLTSLFFDRNCLLTTFVLVLILSRCRLSGESCE